MKENKEATSKAYYSDESERLWEDGPLCPEFKDAEYNENDIIFYPSDYRNAYNEPVFYQSGQGEYLAKPVVNAQEPGFFRAYPGGLNIDPHTGVIDINHSDAGIRYTIEFWPLERACVARTKVVISGIVYMGYSRSISLTDPRHEDLLILKPYYFGSTADTNSAKIPAPGAPAGKFGIYPTKYPTADLVGLAINPDTGEINLRETILGQWALGVAKNPDGTGGEFPANGVSKDFTIYYQLHTGPGTGVLNKTRLTIHFYNTDRDIPKDLRVRFRQQYYSIYRRSLPLPLLLGMPLTFSSDAPWEALAGLAAALSSFLFLQNGASGSNDPMHPREVIIRR
jgi:hypothetical protein